MNLPPFPSIPQSPEERLRWVQWGEECARMGAEAERLSFYSAQVSGEPATVRDAERWRFARELIGPGKKTPQWHNFMALVAEQPDTPEGFDAAIDAARSGGKGDGE